MATALNIIIKSITELNNRYRDPKSEVRLKLETLWEMGDCLHKLGVKKPHSVGWRIQKETKGLIKRPTVFRSHKVRQIWETKDKLINDVGGLRKMSFLTDMLPLVDPRQKVRGKLSEKELSQIFKYARNNNGEIFKNYLLDLKKKYSHGRLRQLLDKSKYLYKLEVVVESFKKLQTNLLNLFKDSNSDTRNRFKEGGSLEEFRAFSNMCLSLTTKENYRLYKRLGPQESDSNKDGRVTLDEAFDYAKRKHSWTKKGEDTPLLISSLDTNSVTIQ